MFSTYLNLEGVLMMSRPLRLTLACFIVVCTFAVPAFAISVSCSSGAGGQAASSSESFNLDDSTSLRESLILGSGSITLDRQAEGTGKNSLKQSLSGTGYTLQNNIDSQGDLRVSTSSAATAQAASLSQSVGGVGSMSLNLRGREGSTDAGQEASVSLWQPGQFAEPICRAGECFCAARERRWKA